MLRFLAIFPDTSLHSELNDYTIDQLPKTMEEAANKAQSLKDFAFSDGKTELGDFTVYAIEYKITKL